MLPQPRETDEAICCPHSPTASQRDPPPFQSSRPKASRHPWVLSLTTYIPSVSKCYRADFPTPRIGPPPPLPGCHFQQNHSRRHWAPRCCAQPPPRPDSPRQGQRGLFKGRSSPSSAGNLHRSRSPHEGPGHLGPVTSRPGHLEPVTSRGVSPPCTVHPRPLAPRTERPDAPPAPGPARLRPPPGPPTKAAPCNAPVTHLAGLVSAAFATRRARRRRVNRGPVVRQPANRVGLTCLKGC